MRLLPIRPRSRCERRSLRTFPDVTLHPRFPFNVRLTQLVNLTSLVVVGPDDDTRPKTVKLFVNKPNLSFDNCGKKPVATIALTDAQSRGGERVELEYTDFQNVRRVHVYAGSRTTASAR